jgi:hypothetical protein
METERAEFSVRAKRAAVRAVGGALLKDQLLFRSYIISLRKVRGSLAFSKRSDCLHLHGGNFHEYKL